MGEDGGADLYRSVPGQAAAVEQLRAAARRPVHAYLFVGPPGTGAREAATAFAADVLCASGGCGTCLSCRLALDGRHPDVSVVERTGASIRVEQIDEAIRLAARPPSEGERKVIVLVDLHLVEQHYPRLLKTIEEPPPSTVFVVLAESVPPELVTIASRCARVEFGPVPIDVVARVLEDEGVAPDGAREAASASGGRLDRARLLAHDPNFAARQASWRAVPARLDGSGHVVVTLAEELLGGIESVLEPLRARQAGEVAALEERVAQSGERGSGRRELEERHRREQRRVRADELRAGLATLASAYSDALRGAGPLRVQPALAIAAIAALDRAAEALVRNPNEPLLLQGVLAELSELAAA